MSLTVPYSNAMRIGQGFNTYTQEIRLENAVEIVQQDSVARSYAIASARRAADMSTPPGTPPANELSGKATSDENAPLINGIAKSSFSSNVSALLNDVQNKHAVNGKNSPIMTPEDPDLGSAKGIVTKLADDSLPFIIPPGPTLKTSQSVTYSTRAIENVSDVMDALNISTSMSIKYGTIHGNGNSSFVDENKILESELNYLVSVTVNNDARSDTEDMKFQEIPGLPLDRFTEVYGDAFISGFAEGGQFSAVISVKVHDRSNLRAVKQAVDVQLAIGPPTLEIGAKESVDKSHRAAMKNTEITISVNWVGGGDIKKPGVPWTLKSVVAVANAFPSLVARSSARTSAILTRYTSLRSFQEWKWKTLVEERRLFEAKAENKGKTYTEPIIILNYVPCALYTADLFDALMAYKKIWKKISDMLLDPSKYKLRPGAAKKTSAMKRLTNGTTAPTIRTNGSSGTSLKKGLTESPNTNTPTPILESPCQKRAAESGFNRCFTFDVEEGEAGWDLVENNANRSPIPPDPVALNEARLICREAMTLITEEASRLVDHPHLAYAEFNNKTKKTHMKRPNYTYPEVLKSRLPVPVHDDYHLDLSTDGAYLKTQAFAHGDDTWFEHDMVGDAKDPNIAHRFGFGAKYVDFSSLEYSEPQENNTTENLLSRLTLHRFHHHTLPLPKRALRACDSAIGAIGLSFLHDETHNLPRHESDACTFHYGHVHHSVKDNAAHFRGLELAGVDITHIEISYVPGSGYIAGLAFFDEVDGMATERLSWRQWEVLGRPEPEGLERVVNAPPDVGDEGLWRFIGLTGSWVDFWGQGMVLGRVSGVWRRR